MTYNLQREIEIVNEKAEELKAHYLKLADGDMDEAYTMACRGESVIKRRLGQLIAEAE